MSRSAVLRYKNRDVNPQEAGRELKVQAVLTGRLAQRGDNLSVSVELVDVRTNRQIWGERYNRKMQDLLAIQQEISGEISDKLRQKLSPGDKQRLARRSTENSEAYQAYLKGRFYWYKRTEEGFRKGIEYFQQAIEKDPGYALAYSGLADSYTQMYTYGVLPNREALPNAKAAAKRALELDAGLAEAHASIAGVALWLEWNWPAAEAEYRRSIELNPRYVPAHFWYSSLLNALGRHDEAVAESRRALELESLSLVANSNVGQALFHARRYDQALLQLRKTLDLDPAFPLTRWWLGRTLEQMGQYEEAAVLLRSARTQDSPGYAYARAGRTAEAHKALEELKARFSQKHVAATEIAAVYAGLAEPAKALDWLEKAYQERDNDMNLLKVDPRFDPLRSDPRFASLLRRMGLAP